MFGIFRQKKRIDDLKKEVKESFDHVKKDFNKVGQWISHIDDKQKKNSSELENIKNQIIELKADLFEIKEYLSFFELDVGKRLSKQTQTKINKQTLNNVVQTPVQTPVQTDILSNLTVTERAIIWSLLNTEMNLSYEDLASLLGKDKSTLRGQVNSIRQKNEMLIKETKEATGKKRLFIPEEIKEKIIKNVKVRIKMKKNEKNENLKRIRRLFIRVKLLKKI